MFDLRQETGADWWDVEALYDLCFTPARTTLSSYRLRDGVAPVSNLCLIVREPQGTLVGAVRFWPVRVGGAPTLLLGPVAVHPTRQGEGIGRLLVLTGLNMARDKGWKRVLVIGDHLYYSRFGFFRLLGVECPPPTDPKRILGCSLTPGAWSRIDGVAEKWTL